MRRFWNRTSGDLRRSHSFDLPSLPTAPPNGALQNLRNPYCSWKSQPAAGVLKRSLKTGILRGFNGEFATAMHTTFFVSKAGSRPAVRIFAATIIFVFLLLSGSGCGKQQTNTQAKAAPEVTFKPQEMADALHAVVAADREIYSRHILQRLGTEEKLVKVSEHWQSDKALPLPAQVLRLGSEQVQQNGAEFHYILRSLWPLNPKNGPETATEKKGLQAVADHPDTNYYSEESLGGRRYFTAVYPDRATVPSCVECHNTHPASTKKDLKIGDVIGGIVVRVPLEF
jgi:uncharacterized protein DUF3365